MTFVTIGDFSRMTYLTVKALRHYHEEGLLTPAEVDSGSGYRRYALAQVATAQVIRRFREVDMSLEDIRIILDAEDEQTRTAIVDAHLERMQARLDHAQTVVTSLRNFLENPAGAVPVAFRAVGPQRAAAIVEEVAAEDAEQWLAAAFDELYAVLERSQTTPAGSPGALYSSAYFEHGRGEVVAFVPAQRWVPADGRTAPTEIPAARLATALHEGPLAELDRTYAALGRFVAEHATHTDGPARERDSLVATGQPTSVRWR